MAENHTQENGRKCTPKGLSEQKWQNKNQKTPKMAEMSHTRNGRKCMPQKVTDWTIQGQEKDRMENAHHRK